MFQINAYRHHYGVGQGNFHIQELVFSGPNPSNTLTHRFVYDCGGYPKAVKWCVDHATDGPDRLKINAVYLSHFESDHINGLIKLCTKADIDRIYAPHIDKAQAAHIIAMQIANAGRWTIELQNFINTVVTVANGGPINGVPVTQIEGGETPPSQQPNDQPEPLTNANRESALTLGAPIGKVVAHSKKVTISLSMAGAGAGPVKSIELWEMVHWYYAGHSAITNGILSALRSAFNNFQVDIEPGLELNAQPAETALTLTWFQKHFTAVADIYVAVMQLHNNGRVLSGQPKIPNDHNVVSLCLYSGPVSVNLELEQYRTWPQPPGYWYSKKFGLYAARYVSKPYYRSAWLATGDAMLKKSEIWTDFERHFGSVRLDGCLTVQIPHHGADAPSSDNYNTQLIRTNQNCVISAGANSKHGHPHKNVIKDILAKPALLRLVNENEHMGFIEYLKYQLK